MAALGVIHIGTLGDLVGWTGSGAERVTGWWQNPPGSREHSRVLEKSNHEGRK